MTYTQVHYSGEIFPKGLVFQGDHGIWLLPLQAVADRMELYGFESIEQTLEYLGLERDRPEISDTLHGPIQEAYARVVHREYQATVEGASVSAARQTLMQPMDIGTWPRTTLDEARDWALSELGMEARVHSFGAARMLDDARPVEKTRPAAAQALDADEGTVEAAVALVHEHAEELELWQVFNLGTYEPRVWPYMQRQTKE